MSFGKGITLSVATKHTSCTLQAALSTQRVFQQPVNLLLSEPARLSVDLDFNYIGHADRERMREERPEVERAVARLGQGHGYRVQWSRDAHAGRKLYLAYTNLAGTADRIEIDLNYLHRVPLGDLEEHVMWQPPGIDRPSLWTLSWAELAAGKLRATLDRCMPRDLFDTLRLPDLVGRAWQSPFLRSLHVALAATLPQPLMQYNRDRFERVTDEQIGEQLEPMLSRDQKVEAVRLKEQAWQNIAPLVEGLTSSEQEYIDQVHQGELLPEVLFPDDGEMVERLSSHPALRWKLDNVRKHQTDT